MCIVSRNNRDRCKDGLKISNSNQFFETVFFSPFWMTEPGRQFSTANYRYGFNGKENDPETKTQDYGLRIYDPRLGKFLSVDPLAADYPWNSLYAFAENDVLRCVDLDGGERKLATMDQYEYNGSWGVFDFLKAIPNAAGKTYNGVVASTWNSGVDFFTSAARGTLGKDLKAEATQIVNNVKGNAVASYDYLTNVSSRQFFQDFGNYLSQPERIEDILLFAASTKIPFGGGKANLLKLETSQSTGIPSFKNAKWAQPKYSNGFSKVGQEALGLKTIEEAVVALKNGTMKSNSLPIDYIIRNNEVYILNTRSSVALTKAGIDRSKWNWIDRTGKADFEKRLNNQLDGSNGHTEIVNSVTGEKTKR